jgi:4-carboxymuconolactone decarboxylase
MQAAEETFRRLAIGDRVLLATAADQDNREAGVARLDARTEALVRVGVLVALRAEQSSYATAVGSAIRAGATLDDLAATLLAVTGLVGTARIISATPRIALAAGYDIDSALESTDPDR